MKQLSVTLIVLFEHWQLRSDLAVSGVSNARREFDASFELRSIPELANQPPLLLWRASDCFPAKILLPRWVPSRRCSLLSKVYKSKAVGGSISHSSGGTQSRIMKCFILVLLALIPFSDGNLHFISVNLSQNDLQWLIFIFFFACSARPFRGDIKIIYFSSRSKAENNSCRPYEALELE